LEQNANTVLGLFIKMIAQYVRQYGRLRVGDIVQHLTIVDVDKITDDAQLVYKSFVVSGKGQKEQKKIEFTNKVSEEPVTGKKALSNSYDVLKEEEQKGMEIYKVNPKLFRDLCYQVVVSPDVLHPRSEDLERAMKLELYDRAIANPKANQELVFKDFLLGAYKEIKKPDDYIQAQPPAELGQMGAMNPADTAQTAQPKPSPLAGLSKVGLPQAPSVGALGMK
jgi:hypothetical protein